MKKIVHLRGEPKYVSDTKNVTLRGTYLRGNYNDLPNLIFFPEACDLTNNWIPFFTDPNNRILDYRNVWLINPRNFGNSDRFQSFDMQEMANDVARFMYENKISTATLAGHGLGGKLAVAVGCYHAERVSGVFGIDTAPLDHRYFEAFKEFKHYIAKLKETEIGNKDVKTIFAMLKNDIADPKWRNIFCKNITTDPKNPEHHTWNFELDYLHQNLSFNKADSLGAWTPRHGLFTGRVNFIFPEYSRWVHLNTNTLPILKVCIKAKGFGHDIFYIQGDDNPMNHWIYEQTQSSFVTARKLLKFLTMYDGVHVLLKDRSEIGKVFIPDVRNSRKNPDWVYSDYSPTHLHHNWRFSNIYEEADKYAKDPNYNPNSNTSPSAPTKK